MNKKTKKAIENFSKMMDEPFRVYGSFGIGKCSKPEKSFSIDNIPAYTKEFKDALSKIVQGMTERCNKKVKEFLKEKMYGQK